MFYLLLGAILSALPIFCVLQYKKSNQNLWIFIAMLFNSLLVIVYVKLMNNTNSTTTYTLIKILSIIGVGLFCWLFYNEKLKWLGLVFAILSIYLMS